MKFLKERKGFTLAEMLIVMAVVVVLAAAVIPEVGSTIEGARESNDLATMAAAYTEAYTKAAAKAASGAITGSEDITVAFTQTTMGWGLLTSPKVGGKDAPAVNTNVKTLKFSFTKSGDGIVLGSITSAA